MKVILIDDNEKRAELLCSWMASIGVLVENITVVDNTTEARFLISRNYYDVLLLDVVLPKRKKDKALWSNGIELLRYISASTRVKTPEKIVGITAYSEDISSFKDKFEEHCLNVVEVKLGTTEWIPKLSKAFAYIQSSKIARLRADGDLVAVTVHGIRTFGQWQERLKKMVQGEASYINFLSYKYGYFSVIFFVFPFFQRREVNRLKLALKGMIAANSGKEFIVFSHSFGTYLFAHAFQELLKDGESFNIKTLVLSGSVLKATHDWSFTQAIPGLKLINECGSDDRILWLSEAFVPKTGMAGRTGFYGLNSDQFRNRYHLGGHSLYFKGDLFMKDNWLPLFVENPSVPLYDERGDLSFIANIIEQLSVLSGKFGLYLLLLLAVFAL
ncbi:response regulator [Pseudomonas helleri]|uniref:Response regulator n=1 Tax=Pseudomonas helleri TaxID=1608996 RepID=A0A6I1WR93_9PSED|nr:response regulator [Pseudomonas helleri]MQU43760.1 response regulator [Pseudomonas helleri]